MSKMTLNDNICRNITKMDEVNIKIKLETVFNKLIKSDTIASCEIPHTQVKYMIWYALMNEFGVKKSMIAKIYTLAFNSVKEGILKIEILIKRKHQPRMYNTRELYENIIIPMIQAEFL